MSSYHNCVFFCTKFYFILLEVPLYLKQNIIVFWFPYNKIWWFVITLSFLFIELWCKTCSHLISTDYVFTDYIYIDFQLRKSAIIRKCKKFATTFALTKVIWCQDDMVHASSSYSFISNFLVKMYSVLKYIMVKDRCVCLHKTIIKDDNKETFYQKASSLLLLFQTK